MVTDGEEVTVLPAVRHRENKEMNEEERTMMVMRMNEEQCPNGLVLLVGK